MTNSVILSLSIPVWTYRKVTPCRSILIIGRSCSNVSVNINITIQPVYFKYQSVPIHLHLKTPTGPSQLQGRGFDHLQWHNYFITYLSWLFFTWGILRWYCVWKSCGAERGCKALYLIGRVWLKPFWIYRVKRSTFKRGKGIYFYATKPNWRHQVESRRYLGTYTIRVLKIYRKGRKSRLKKSLKINSTFSKTFGIGVSERFRSVFLIFKWSPELF